MRPVTVGLVINPTHYRCRNPVCGYMGPCFSFPYLQWSTILCCPECAGTNLQRIRVHGDGSVVEESGS